MANRLLFGNSTEIGFYCKLTNAYCLVGTGGSNNFYSAIEAELEDAIPIIKTSVGGGCSGVGRFCIGNKNGLLLPHTTTLEELLHIKRSLPDGVALQLMQEELCASSRFIACNDYVALAHADLHSDAKELITDILGIEVFKPEDYYSFFSGSYCALSNIGGLIHPHASKEVLDELSAALGVPFETGTVNRGSQAIAPGMTVNDWTAFCGSSTTRAELCVIDRVFKLREPL
ncbi:eukaryotic translation initiation factor 6-2 [Medicago truncatula]|uniref:Eukaryotic translation initiation factor 6 n=1 Tax=Medicago truncatula TaxID=3880 RepID=G7JSA7_MEDTR|nr:eukaryotic translation initiation factor 6-2 [Medicago truncatula]AES87046.1 eukaryotic translation initiation factor 6-like protein [Medicago truncatula]